MKCQQLNSLLSFGAWRFCVDYSVWVYLWCDNLNEDVVKANVVSRCTLVEFCQFRNVGIDFVKYLTASKGNVKIMIFTIC